MALEVFYGTLCDVLPESRKFEIASSGGGFIHGWMGRSLGSLELDRTFKWRTERCRFYAFRAMKPLGDFEWVITGIEVLDDEGNVISAHGKFQKGLM